MENEMLPFRLIKRTVHPDLTARCPALTGSAFHRSLLFCKFGVLNWRPGLTLHDPVQGLLLFPLFRRQSGLLSGILFPLLL